MQNNNIKQKNNAIEVPGNTDVLCGRGGHCTTHPGNVQFRMLCDEHKAAFLKCSTKPDKIKLANEVITKVPGRFLKQEGEVWYDIGPQAALKKVLNSLRQQIPTDGFLAAMRKQQVPASSSAAALPVGVAQAVAAAAALTGSNPLPSASTGESPCGSSNACSMTNSSSNALSSGSASYIPQQVVQYMQYMEERGHDTNESQFHHAQFVPWMQLAASHQQQHAQQLHRMMFPESQQQQQQQQQPHHQQPQQEPQQEQLNSPSLTSLLQEDEANYHHQYPQEEGRDRDVNSRQANPGINHHPLQGEGQDQDANDVWQQINPDSISQQATNHKRASDMMEHCYTSKEAAEAESKYHKRTQNQLPIQLQQSPMQLLTGSSEQQNGYDKSMDNFASEEYDDDNDDGAISSTNESHPVSDSPHEQLIQLMQQPKYDSPSISSSSEASFSKGGGRGGDNGATNNTHSNNTKDDGTRTSGDNGEQNVMGASLPTAANLTLTIFAEDKDADDDVFEKWDW